MSDFCSDLIDAEEAVFDPFTVPYVKPSWHSRIILQPAPLTSRVYGMEIKGGPCAIWTGQNNGKGHGKVTISGDKWYLHRWSYMCHHNVWIPPDVHIDHLCRNRPCFNPYHHEPTTPIENFLRGDGPKFTFKSMRELASATMYELPF